MQTPSLIWGVSNAMCIGLLALVMVACSTAPPPATPSGAASTSSLTNEVRTQAPLRHVTFGAVTPVALGWPFFVAREKGLFAKHGVEVDSTYTGSTPALVQQTVSGDFKLSETACESAVRGVEAGAPIVVLGATANVLPYSMVAAPSIRSAQDLVGKQVVLSAAKTSATVYFDQWLTRNGVDPSRVDRVYDGATPNRYAAVVNGSVAAGLVTQPVDFQALDAGYHKVMDYGTEVKAFDFLCIIARKDWLASNTDITRHFLAALAEGVAWLYDPTNKDDAIDILTRTLLSDAATSQKTYAYYTALNPFPRNLAVDEPGMQAVLDVIVAQGDMQPPTPPPSKYIDPAYLPS